MTKFSRKGKGKSPGISTASLPDIVFMLLFFFMVSTVMKETTRKVDIKPAIASEVVKLERRSLVSFIYIGRPLETEIYGSAPRMQLNDAFATNDEIREFISSERDNLEPVDQPKMMVSLKADQSIPMGIITDVKQELRKASALKINYSSARGTQKRIFDNLKNL